MIRQSPARNNVIGSCVGLVLAASIGCSVAVADNPQPPSRHQMMKECMAKQKASEAGRTQEDMKNSCKDATKTEKQNADKASKDEKAEEPKS